VRKRLCRKKRGKKVSGITEELRAPVVLKKQANNNQSAFYKSGPVLAMPNIHDQEGGSLKNKKDKTPGTEEQMLEPSSMPPIKGKGSPAQKVAMATSVDLDGRTDAEYDGGSFSTENVRVSEGEGCESCSEEGQCIRARGVLVARFHVTTTVTLPSVSDFPELTPCQQTRVQSAIDNVLAPHEQEHVQAFRQYNGVTRTPFDVTLCRSEFDSTIQGLFDSQETTRRATAQGASDALDPFTFTVDIDCEEPSDESSAHAEEGEEPSEESESQEEDVVAPTEESGPSVEENEVPPENNTQTNLE
jgi:hypothetical protein